MKPAQYLLLLAAVAAACESKRPPGEPAEVAAVTQVDSSSALPNPAVFDWRPHLGRVELDRNRVLCFVASRGTVSAGDSLWLVSEGIGSQQVEMGIAGPSGACDALHDDLEEVFPVALLSSTPASAPVSIAVLGSAVHVEVRDSLAVADLDQDGEPEFFGFCTSTEGVHLTVWTGQVAKGIRRWHQYHQLSYDVEPSCTEAEMSEPYD